MAQKTGLVRNEIIGSFIHAKSAIQYGKDKAIKKKRGLHDEF